MKIVCSPVYYYIITNYQCVDHGPIFLNRVPDVLVVTRAHFNTCSGNVQDYYSGGIAMVELELHAQADNGKPTCLLFSLLK